MLLALAAAASTGGCASGGGSVSSKSTFPESKWGPASLRVASDGEQIRKGGGVYKVGDPYQINGRWYDPREQPDYDRVGTASWYGADFHGRKTSNGEVYDMNALTAAHPTLPMPSYAYVTNLSNGRTILVRINDRGPYVGDRMIDLSRATSRELGLDKRGTGKVRVRYAGRAPLSGDDRREREYLAAQEWKGGSGYAQAEPMEASREVAFEPRRERSQSTWRDPDREIVSERGWRPTLTDADERATWSPRAYRSALAQ